MSNTIAAASTTTPAAATTGTDAAAMEKFEGMLAQRMMMNMQQGQQAMSKSMSKMTEQIKASMQDEE